MQRVTLFEFMRGRVKLTEQHLESFKNLIGKGLRTPRKIYMVKNMTLEGLKAKSTVYRLHNRVTFYIDGTCDFTANQEYASELRQLRESIIGK